MVKQTLLFSVLLGTIATFISNSPQHAPTLLKPVSDTVYFEEFPPYKSVQKNEKLALFKGNMQLTPFKYTMVKPFNKEGLSYVKVKYDSAGFLDKMARKSYQPFITLVNMTTFLMGYYMLENLMILLTTSSVLMVKLKKINSIGKQGLNM
jgi:hypothetical protein